MPLVKTQHYQPRQRQKILRNCDEVLVTINDSLKVMSIVNHKKVRPELSFIVLTWFIGRRICAEATVKFKIWPPLALSEEPGTVIFALFDSHPQSIAIT